MKKLNAYMLFALAIMLCIGTGLIIISGSTNCHHILMASASLLCGMWAEDLLNSENTQGKEK